MKTITRRAVNRLSLRSRRCSIRLAMSIGVFGIIQPGLFAQGVASEPAGFYRINCPGNSDTIVSIPFTRPIAARGLVKTVGADTLQISGSPGWTTGQFVYSAGTQTNTYFFLLRSGAKEGYAYTITANTSDTLTLDLSNADLTGINAGDRLGIIPYWTLGSVFPGGAGVNATQFPSQKATEVFLPDLTTAGIDLSSAKTYYFKDGFWQQSGLLGVNKNDDLLLSDSYITVRHNVATNTTIVARGSVLTTKWTVPIGTSIASKRDNAVAIPRPVPVTLNASGLISSGSFSPSISASSHTDELFVFDNDLIGHDKSSAATYYYLNNTWRKVGAIGIDAGNDVVFTPGTGFLIRKNTAPLSPFWVNAPTY